MQVDADDIALILSGVEILQDLDVDAIEDIARSVRFTRFIRGDLMVTRGKPGARLFIIFDGQVQVHLPDQKGREAKDIILRKGAVVGEMSMLTGNPYSADVVALTDTTAMYLDREQFMALIEKHKSFAECMSQLMSERIAQNGEINRVGKYDVVEKLGEGAMAVVFSAYDKELDREVAVKMLKYELAYDPEFLERFEREARIIASLQHPHIVNVIEIINEFSTRFIVMEKLDGENLQEVMKRKGVFSTDQSREILFQVAKALQYAHAQGSSGIVHRDIKPANIMMDGHGNIKLTDFGVSGPPQNENVSVEGSPNYLAPEVINGTLVDGRADIYALGVTAYFMLTNRQPYKARSIRDLQSQRINNPLPDVRDSRPEVDVDFAAFIKRALTVPPEERLQDWEDIKNILNPSGDQKDNKLSGNEVALTIRIQDADSVQSTRILEGIRKLLRDEGVRHSIEMLSGDTEAPQLADEEFISL